MSRFGRVTVFEQVYQSVKEKKQVRPFQLSARVCCRGLSLGLQRAITDLGSDTSFSSAVEKVREHYGVDVSISSVREVTERHGSLMQLETEIPVRRCLRYIESRPDCFDYKGALERGLPIGSGEIESGHKKSVLQSRLKLSGAWWKQKNAEKIMALRTTRANKEWQS